MNSICFAISRRLVVLARNVIVEIGTTESPHLVLHITDTQPYHPPPLH